MLKDPTLMIPEVADLKNLQPFYDRLSPYIRDVDPTRLIFFEGVTWGDLAQNGDLALGFTHPPGGEQYANTSVLSFHYYIPPNWSPENGEIGYLDRRLGSAQQLGVGAMLTEFSINGNPSEATTHDLCDELLLSWQGWDYKEYSGALNGTCTGCSQGPFYLNGSMNWDVIHTESRTYAQATAGDIISMSFNTTTLAFTLVYSNNPSCSLPTDIYLNEALHYPNGFTVAISPIGAATWTNEVTNHVEVTTSSSTAAGAQITVSITAN